MIKQMKKSIAVIILVLVILSGLTACSSGGKSRPEILIHEWVSDEIVAMYPVHLYLYEDGAGFMQYFPLEKSSLFSEDEFNWEVQGDNLLLTHEDASERRFDKSYSLKIDSTQEEPTISLDGYTYHIK